MSSEKQRVILGVLGVLVAAVWVRGLTARPVRLARPAPVEGLNLSSAPTVNTFASSRSPKILTASSHTEWGRNPFVVAPAPAAAQEKAAKKEHILGGVLWDPQSPSAVLNNRLVNVGDEVNGWRVVEIREKEVKLSDGSNTKTLAIK